jgi:hypothetical protein
MLLPSLVAATQENSLSLITWRQFHSILAQASAAFPSNRNIDMSAGEEMDKIYDHFNGKMRMAQH